MAHVFILGSECCRWPDRLPVGKGRIPVPLYTQGQAAALPPRAFHPQYLACWAGRTPLEPCKFPVTPAKGRSSLFHRAEVSCLGLPGLDHSLPETNKYVNSSGYGDGVDGVRLSLSQNLRPWSQGLVKGMACVYRLDCIKKR